MTLRNNWLCHDCRHLRLAATPELMASEKKNDSRVMSSMNTNSESGSGLEDESKLQFGERGRLRRSTGSTGVKMALSSNVQEHYFPAMSI